MDLSQSFREMFQLQHPPSCLIVINSANSGVIECWGDGSVCCMLSQRLVIVKLGLVNSLLHNTVLNVVYLYFATLIYNIYL